MIETWQRGQPIQVKGGQSTPQQTFKKNLVSVNKHLDRIFKIQMADNFGLTSDMQKNRRKLKMRQLLTLQKRKSYEWKEK